MYNCKSLVLMEHDWIKVSIRGNMCFIVLSLKVHTTSSNEMKTQSCCHRYLIHHKRLLSYIVVAALEGRCWSALNLHTRIEKSCLIHIVTHNIVVLRIQSLFETSTQNIQKWFMWFLSGVCVRTQPSDKAWKMAHHMSLSPSPASGDRDITHQSGTIYHFKFSLDHKNPEFHFGHWKIIIN